MTELPDDADALRHLLAATDPDRSTPGSPALVVVDLDAIAVHVVAPRIGRAQVIVGLTTSGRPETHPSVGACDVALTAGDPALDAITRTVDEHPLASVALAQLLRGSEGRSLDDGLLLESAVYSTLLAGPEFARWRARRTRRPPRAEHPPLVVERSGPRLDITLTRPEVRNALDAAMRDALLEAFRLVALDDTITEVRVRGAGRSFCSGGDLDEFGTAPDPATAHLVRSAQSVGRAIYHVAGRTTVRLHGACAGSGIELPAFAGTVVATPDTTLALPELAMGLIPGAGGTTSITRRIGRHRTARLALTGTAIDARTALDWGLIDAIDPPPDDRGDAGSRGAPNR